MTTYKIKVWQSGELYKFCDTWYDDAYRAAKVAKTYLEGAFHDHSDTADVSVPINTIPAPKEDCGSFDGTDICDDDGHFWNSMFNWWRNYVKANCTDVTLARDTNLLIVANSHCKGGKGTGQFAFACQGKSLAKLDPDVYTKFGDACEDFAVDTIQEEVAHSLHYWGNSTDQDGDGAVSHDYGTVKYKDWNGYITPVGQVGTDGCQWDCEGVNYNNCDEYSNKSDADWDDDGNVDGWAHWYSDCSINHFGTNT